MSKHTLEKKDGGNHFILDGKIDIKYVEQLGNDNGWCIFDKDSYHQMVYRSFENALLTAMGDDERPKEVLTRPAGD
jgi:hypothetical protein